MKTSGQIYVTHLMLITFLPSNGVKLVYFLRAVFETDDQYSQFEENGGNGKLD